MREKMYRIVLLAALLAAICLPVIVPIKMAPSSYATLYKIFTYTLVVGGFLAGILGWYCSCKREILLPLLMLIFLRDPMSMILYEISLPSIPTVETFLALQQFFLPCALVLCLREVFYLLDASDAGVLSLEFSGTGSTSGPIFSYQKAKDRPLCKLVGNWTGKTRVFVHLYVIQKHRSAWLSSHTLWRVQHGKEGKRAIPQEISLFLAEKNAKQGKKKYDVKCVGAERFHTKSTGKSCIPVSIQKESFLLSQDIKNLRDRQEYILYILGDAKFAAISDMSPQRFAQANGGNYLLVTISFSDGHFITIKK